MNKQRIKVTALEIITGKDLIRNPYTIHNIIPAQRMANIPREISLVDFDFHALINCGRKANVVNVPAIKPKIVLKFILKSPIHIWLLFYHFLGGFSRKNIFPKNI